MDHPSQDPPNRCGESLHTKKPLETAAQLRYTSKTLHVREADAMRRDVRAGRRSTIGNRVCPKRVSRVRIPSSPPENLTPVRAFFIHSYQLRLVFGRMAERLNAAVSKTVLPVLLVTRVQIPLLPPEIMRRLSSRRFFNATTFIGCLCSFTELPCSFRCVNGGRLLNIGILARGKG